METNVKDTDIKQQLSDKLDFEIQEKKILLSNLEAQQHQEKVRRESQKKLEDVQKTKQINEETLKVARFQETLKAREKSLEVREQATVAREQEIEKREQSYIRLEEDIEKYQQERANLLSYKYKTNKELDETIEKINECKEQIGSIEQREENLKFREMALVDKERFWNDQIGKLEEAQTKLKEDILNFESLNKEALNGRSTEGTN